MIQNYFFLNRIILEVNVLLRNAKILEIFSQEKGAIIVHCESLGGECFVEFSVIPGKAYFTIKNKYSRAKKNTINFFEGAINERIINFEIATDDRIIKIKLESSEIYFVIRGKFTNVFYLDKRHRLHSFKLMDEETLDLIKKEFSIKSFIFSWNNLFLDLEANENYLEEIRKKYPVIGSDIFKEVKNRSANSKREEIKKLIGDVLEEIKNSSPCIFIDKELQEVKHGFENFTSIPFTEKKIFDSVIDAQNFLLSREQYFNAKKSRLKLIRNHLERELNKVSSKIHSLQGVIERGSKEAEYSKIGKLLLTNLNNLRKGMESVSVVDVFNGNKKIEIKLNPKFTPQKNVDYYFDKSKSERTSFAKTVELFNKADKYYLSLKKTIDSINYIESVKELDELMKKLKIKTGQEKQYKEEIASKFKHYLIDDKYHVYVGKDSKNNDLLTTKFAKQNDYWFHSRGASGSHTLLRIENTKEAVPKSVLKKVASLAAYHSKAKTSGTATVAYTFKKYVVKKKGDPAGTVHLLREDVLLVKPEIPKGCEFITDE